MKEKVIFNSLGEVYSKNKKNEESKTKRELESFLHLIISYLDKLDKN